MSKKRLKNINYFEDYQMLAIVSHLTDYTICYHINSDLKFDFIKYEDLIFATTTDTENSFSWYYYYDMISRTTYYLIGNKDASRLLIPSQKIVDYFLLIKSPISIDSVKVYANGLRKIPNITAVFDLNMGITKDMDLLLESIELHELEVIKKRKG